MEVKRCSEQGCIDEAEYACQCTSPEALTCAEHLKKHLDLPNRAHTFDSILIDPCEETKEAILLFLTKRESKHQRLKKEILAFFKKSLLDLENDTRKLIKNLDCSLDVVNKCFSNISQTKKISKSEKDQILRLLSLQPDEALHKIRRLIPENSDWYDTTKVFCGLNKKIKKTTECFIKDFEDYQQKNLTKIEVNLEEYNKRIIITNKKLEKIKEYLSSLKTENKKLKKELDDLKETISQKTESKTSLLNSQNGIIIKNFNQKPKEAEECQIQDVLNIYKQNLINKKSGIFEGPNTPEIEKDFRLTSLLYNTEMEFKKICSPHDAQDPLLKQAYQDYVDTYNLKTTLFNFRSKHRNYSHKYILYIRNTENGSKEKKYLKTSVPFTSQTSIVQLPNGKLFCYGGSEAEGVTLIIDRNGEVKKLPSGNDSSYHSAIYFNSNVYCFGGHGSGNVLTLSSRFSLDKNRWIKLTSLPLANNCCSSAMLNGNIVIAGYNKNIWVYSIDIDSFSIIT